MEYSTLDQARITEAKKTYSEDIVGEVMMIVDLSDADGAHTHFEDNNMYDHADCVEMLYFEFE